MDGLSYFDGKRIQRAWFADLKRPFSEEQKEAYNEALLDLHILLLDNLDYGLETRKQIKRTLDALYLR